jgi:hypothetical protein
MKIDCNELELHDGGSSVNIWSEAPSAAGDGSRINAFPGKVDLLLAISHLLDCTKLLSSKPRVGDDRPFFLFVI